MVYSNRQTRNGILCACMIGTVLVTFAMTVGMFIENAVLSAASGVSQPTYEFQAMEGLAAVTILLVIGGLPIALIAGIPAGYLVVGWFNLRYDGRIWRFALGGAVAAFLLSLAGTVFYASLPRAALFDPETPTLLERWGQITNVNGVKTVFGWWVEAYLTLRFVLIGALSGLIARRIIGPPKGPE